MARTPHQYQAMIGMLAPPGDAMRAPNLAQLWLAMGDGLSKLEADAEALLLELDPRTAVHTIGAWEAMTGLPDPHLPLATTLAARRQAVIAQLTWRGGVRKADFINLAAALGYTVTITQRFGFYPGYGSLPADILPPGGCFWWTMNVTIVDGQIPPYRVLEYLVRKRTPDHTFVTFNYVSD